MGKIMWSLDDLNNPDRIATVRSLRQLGCIHLPGYESRHGNPVAHLTGSPCSRYEPSGPTTHCTVALLDAVGVKTTLSFCTECRYWLTTESGYRQAARAIGGAYNRPAAKAGRGPWSNPSQDAGAVAWTNSVAVGGPDIVGAWWRTITGGIHTRETIRTALRVSDSAATNERTLVLTKGTLTTWLLLAIHAAAEVTYRHYAHTGLDGGMPLWVSVVDRTTLNLIIGTERFGSIKLPGIHLELGTLDAATAATVAEAAALLAGKVPPPVTRNDDTYGPALHAACVGALITHA